MSGHNMALAPTVSRAVAAEQIGAAAPRRLLLVSYHFPPVGGAGVQRPLKFVKYLREFGWEPTVLVADNPSVPVFDESLLRDLPESVRIVRAKTLEPGYAAKQAMSAAKPVEGTPRRSIGRMVKSWVRGAATLALQPDPQVLWLPAAYRAAMRSLREAPHAAILATAPSYSNLLLGAMLKRRTGLPLLLDYRDEWDLSSVYLEHSHKDDWSRTVQQRMQRWILRQADVVIATTKRSTAQVLKRARESGSRAMGACIYNGFDRPDFVVDTQVQATIPKTERFRIVYTGTLWNLTTIAPVVEALLRLAELRPEIAAQVELAVVGRKTPEQQAHLHRLNGTAVQVTNVEYCDHTAAIAWMQSADALLLLLTDGPGADRVAPAKLFEYLAVGQPILAVLPPGETAEIVSSFWPSGHQLPQDVAGMAGWIERAVKARQMGAEAGRALSLEEQSAADRFSRRELTRELAELLDSVTASSGKADRP
jgi:glycosyltransferase involved in cell wall biosynthesis